MIEILMLIFELLTIVGCLFFINQKTIKFDIALLFLIIYESIVQYGIVHWHLPQGLLLSTYIVIFIYSIYEFKENVLVTLAGELIAIIITGIIQLIIYIPVSIVIGNIEQDKIVVCCVNCICVLLVYLISKKRCRVSIVEYIKQKSIITYICLIISIIYMFIQISNLRETHYWDEIHFAEVLIWLLLILILWIQCQKNRIEINQKEKQLKKQGEYVQNFENQLNHVKFKQHDFKNHLSALQGMAREIADKDTLSSMNKQYSEYLLQDEAYKELVKGGHPILTGFLNEKIRKMQELKIDFVYEISYLSIEEVMSIYEWVEVIGILLDNAIEAVEGSLLKQIFMELVQDDTQVKLSVANVSRYIPSKESAQFFKYGYSLKGENRGIGLTKVNDLVLKKKGTISVKNVFRNENNCIEFTICMKNREK